MTLSLVACAPYAARLTLAACAERHRRAQAPASTYLACRACPEGAARAGVTPPAPPPATPRGEQEHPLHAERVRLAAMPLREAVLAILAGRGTISTRAMRTLLTRAPASSLYRAVGLLIDEGLVVRTERGRLARVGVR